MKIDRKKIYNRCGFDQRECYDLAVRLAGLNDDVLINEIRKIKVWHYGKCELGLWADVLDRLDGILADGVTKVGSWTLKLDQPGNEHLVGKIIAILEFTGHLIEHSIYRYLYGSWEHILALFGTSNMDILLALLGLFYNFSKRSNYFSRLDLHNRKIVLERLDSIAEMPASAGTMQYEFMQEAITALGKEEQSQDVFVKPKSHRRKLTLRNLHTQYESPSELMEGLIPKYNMTNTSDQMALFARLRLCVYFGKPELRQKLIYTRMQALSILCYTNEVEEKCLSWEIVEELVDVLKLPGREFMGIKACALRTLTAIIHCGKLQSCWNILRNMTGMNSYHGHFPTVMRDWIEDLVTEKFQPYAGSIEQQFTTAILSFLYHLACTNEVNSNQGNLVTTGLLNSMKDIITWHTPETDYISYATRAVRVTDQILLSFQVNGNNTNQKATIDALVERLNFEVNICLNSDMDALTGKSVALNTQRVGFIKSMLNLIKRLILDNEWSDTLLVTMEGQLPDILRRIFKNYTTKFNPQLCLFSMEVITNFVYNQPSCMSTMQSRDLTKDILLTLTENPLPVNRDFLVTLPTLLSAVSINGRGVNEIKESNIISKYIDTLTDSRYVSAMRNKRIREMMVPADNGDSTAATNSAAATTSHTHPSTPTSYQMSNSMNELARVNHTVFRPIIYDSICRAFKRIVEVGTYQTAPLLTSTGRSGPGKKLSGSIKDATVATGSVPLTNEEGDVVRLESSGDGGGCGASSSTNMFGRESSELIDEDEDEEDEDGDEDDEEGDGGSGTAAAAVAESVLAADREVQEIMEMSGDENETVLSVGAAHATTVDFEPKHKQKTMTETTGSSSNRLDECTVNATVVDEADSLYLMDYIANVCKFMERFLSDQQPESSLRSRIYNEAGISTILDVLTIPALPYDFPSSPACQSIQKIFEYLLTWASQPEAQLIYRHFSSTCAGVGARLKRLHGSQLHSILLKDYVTRSEDEQLGRRQHMALRQPSGGTASKHWTEHGVCLLHDLAILSSVVTIYDKITDRLSSNLRQDIISDLKDGILTYARLLAPLNWEAIVLMNLLFEDEDACLEDLKKLCINEKFCIEGGDDAHCATAKRCISACQQLFTDNPRSEKIIRRMLQLTQKVANDLVDLLVTLTKFCCVKPDYSCVVRVRYNRANSSVPAGRHKMALLASIADYCKHMLEWESPYARLNVASFDSDLELNQEKACAKILADIKFIHPIKYSCFTTIHRILTGGDQHRKPYLGFFYSIQNNNGLEVFFNCANKLMDTIRFVKYLDSNSSGERSVKVMLESFLVSVERMTEIRRIKQELEESCDRDIKEKFDISLYERMIRAYMLEPISRLFSLSSTNIDLLNYQSQESLMSIIAFLTSYIFDRDVKEPKSLDQIIEDVTAISEENEQKINQHIDFIVELGFTREVARSALEACDGDPTQAVTTLFNSEYSIGHMKSQDTESMPKKSKPGTASASESSIKASIEKKLDEIELKNVKIKQSMKESFHINLFSLQKEKGIDIITRIVDILLLTGDIQEFLEKILPVKGCKFLAVDSSYLTVLRGMVHHSTGQQMTGANIEESPNGLHILTLLYNKVRLQLTAAFSRHHMVSRLMGMTQVLLTCFWRASHDQPAHDTTSTMLKHLTQLWLIIDQYERTALALRIRRDVIMEYRGASTWFWINEQTGMWHSVTNNAQLNKSYRDGMLRAYCKQSNSNYLFNFVTLTQKNEASQQDHPIKLLPIKRDTHTEKVDDLSEYESRIVSSVPDCLRDEEVVQISSDVLSFVLKLRAVDSQTTWECLQAACCLLIRLCERYPVAAANMASNFRSTVPWLCALPHAKQYTHQLLAYTMILIRQQFENEGLVRLTISKILDKTMAKGASTLHRVNNYNEKLKKDLFYVIWDSIPLLCRAFDTTVELLQQKIELTNDESLTTYTIAKPSKGLTSAHDQAPFELDKKQAAIVRFLLENALCYYISRTEVWSELPKKLRVGSQRELRQNLLSQSGILDNVPDMVTYVVPSCAGALHSLSGREYLAMLTEMLLSYPSVAAHLIQLRLHGKPACFYLLNMYIQEATPVLETAATLPPSSSNLPDAVTNAQLQQLASLQLIEALLLTLPDSHEPMVAEVARALHHRSGQDNRNIYLAALTRFLLELLQRMPPAVSRKLLLLMYKHRFPADLCRLLATVDCATTSAAATAAVAVATPAPPTHNFFGSEPPRQQQQQPMQLQEVSGGAAKSASGASAVLLDIVALLDCLCRPDRQLYVARRHAHQQRHAAAASKHQAQQQLHGTRSAKRHKKTTNTPVTAVSGSPMLVSTNVVTTPASSSAHATTMEGEEIQHMDTEDSQSQHTANNSGSVFYVDINAWSRNVGRAESGNVEEMDSTCPPVTAVTNSDVALVSGRSTAAPGGLEDEADDDDEMEDDEMDEFGEEMEHGIDEDIEEIEAADAAVMFREMDDDEDDDAYDDDDAVVEDDEDEDEDEAEGDEEGEDEGDEGNTESETDYEDIEEDEGSAGSQDGDSQGEDEVVLGGGVSNAVASSGAGASGVQALATDQSQRILQILNRHHSQQQQQHYFSPQSQHLDGDQDEQDDEFVAVAAAGTAAANRLSNALLGVAANIDDAIHQVGGSSSAGTGGPTITSEASNFPLYPDLDLEQAPPASTTAATGSGSVLTSAGATSASASTFRIADNVYFVTSEAGSHHHATGTSGLYPASAVSAVSAVAAAGYTPTDLAGSLSIQNPLAHRSSAAVSSTAGTAGPPAGSLDHHSAGTTATAGLHFEDMFIPSSAGTNAMRGWRGLSGASVATGNNIPPPTAVSSRIMRMEPRNPRSQSHLSSSSLGSSSAAPLRNFFTINTAAGVSGASTGVASGRLGSSTAPITAASSLGGRTTTTAAAPNLSLDSLEGDADMLELLHNSLCHQPSVWAHLAGGGSGYSLAGTAELHCATNLRRWLVQARLLYGREISDMVMLARARVYAAVHRAPAPPVTATNVDSATTSQIMAQATHPPDAEMMMDTSTTETPNVAMIPDPVQEQDDEDGEESSATLREEPQLMQQGAASVPPDASEEDLDNLSVDQLVAEGIDPSFLEALPPSMRREVILEHRRANRVRQELTAGALPDSVDADTMAELPPSIQEEILSHYRASVTSTANPSTTEDAATSSLHAQGSVEGAAAVAIAAVPDSSFLLSLPAQLRREILADMEHSQLANLSQELAEEARRLRHDHDEAQMRALQANLLSVGGGGNGAGATSTSSTRRRVRQVTSGLSDLLTQMQQHRGRWDQRGIRYVVFSDRGGGSGRQHSHQHHPIFDSVTAQLGGGGGSGPLHGMSTSALPELAAYRPVVGRDGLTTLLALLITSSTSPALLKTLGAALNKTVLSLVCHPLVRSWLSRSIIMILVRISATDHSVAASAAAAASGSVLQGAGKSSTSNQLSSPSNSESSILCTPYGSCNDLSRSSSSLPDDSNQRGTTSASGTAAGTASSSSSAGPCTTTSNNKSLFYHSFQRGFTLTDQVFVPVVNPLSLSLGSTRQRQQQHLKQKSCLPELPDVTIHESVSGAVARSLVETLAIICNQHVKDFFPLSPSAVVAPASPAAAARTNFWQSLAWFMSLKSISLDDQYPDSSELAANEQNDYFSSLLLLLRLPLIQTSTAMLEKLLNTVHFILQRFYKSIASTASNTEVDEGSTSEAAAAPKMAAPVDSRSLSHLIGIICAKETGCSRAAVPLPTDKCRNLAEKLLLDLAKGHSRTRDDVVELLVSNIELVMDALTGQIHKVMDEAVDMFERRRSTEARSSSEAKTHSPEGGACVAGPSGLQTPVATTANDEEGGAGLELLLSGRGGGGHTAAAAAAVAVMAAVNSSSGVATQGGSSGGSGGNSSHARQAASQLPHTALDELRLESVRPFTATSGTGDHLNLLDMLQLLRQLQPARLSAFHAPGPRLWSLLGQLLDLLQHARQPDSVLPFQSLVESFLVCHSTCVPTATLPTPSPMASINIIEDCFMPSSPPGPVHTATAASSSAACKSSKPFLEFAEKHRAVINHVLRRRQTTPVTAPALDQSNFSALLHFPRLLDFDIKRRYFQAKIAQLRSEVDNRYDEELIQVSRHRLFEDSYGRLHRKTPEEWKQRFCIKFINEEGQDGGGLLREWYLKMSHEIFNPDYVLFQVSPDGVTYSINPASSVNSNHMSYFHFVGRFLAKAIFDGKLLQCYFTRALYKHILGVPVRYEDLEKEDNQLYRGLNCLLQHPVSSLNIETHFAVEACEFGQTKMFELVLNGASLPVTEDNKREYVRLVCQQRMTGAVRPQLEQLLRGFYELIPQALISVFNEAELELLICGLPEIDLADLRANTLYNKYSAQSQQILWFWRALDSFGSEDRARFVQFVTGTSKVPLGGFARLEGMNGPTKFQISMASTSTNHLPAAHTCFNSIDLPAYESYEKLRQCLLTAIRECCEGYGMI